MCISASIVVAYPESLFDVATWARLAGPSKRWGILDVALHAISKTIPIEFVVLTSGRVPGGKWPGNIVQLPWESMDICPPFRLTKPRLLAWI